VEAATSKLLLREDQEGRRIVARPEISRTPGTGGDGSARGPPVGAPLLL
jgi:hypothetical protein